MLRIALLILAAAMTLPAAAKLDIYWIDVEGGASTLIVTESGETALMDAGFGRPDDRDAKRILHVLKSEAKASKIDYFITSHFHGDHVGGLAALSKMAPISHFLDHGDSVDKDSDNGKGVWQTYLATAGKRRRIVKPGEKISLGGAELTIVSAHGEVLSAPLPGGGANSLCSNLESRPEDTGENGRSTGYLLKAGAFEFLNLGDLSWNFQAKLACPKNLVGEVDLFQVTHHGVRDDVLPQQMWAVKPLVAVMNNGPKKGAGSDVYETVMKSPGLQDLWQLHRAVQNDDAHNTAEELTANLSDGDDCEAHWIKASLAADGSFTVTNSRNGRSKTYRSR